MKRARAIALTFAAAGVALSCVGIVVDPTRALFAWLAAFAFGFTLAFGALFLVVLAHISKSGWLAVVRRVAEAVSGTLPLLALLFVPILVGAPHLYSWALPLDAMDEATRHVVAEKRAYLSVPFFALRAGFYFVVLVGAGETLRRWSVANDKASTVEARYALTRKMRALSAASLPAIGLAITFASFDWIMSLDPAWYSTMYGFYVFAGGAAGATGLVTLVVARAARPNHALAGAITPEHTHALGRLLLAFVIVWAYVAFSQLLVIWIADLPEEITFYAARVRGSWTTFSWMLAMGHFVAPFFVLLSRDLKRRPAALAVAGGWLVAMHFVDVYWLVLPAHDAGGVRPHWLDAAALLAVCGSMAALALTRFAAAAPFPKHDPEIEAGLSYEAAQ